MGIGIEFLGKCISTEDADWDVDRKSRFAFEKAVITLSAFQKYDGLDQGKAEAIVLALDIRADYVLMDETLGRQIALSYKLQPLGLLGILVLAKQKNLIAAVIPLMDRLRVEANFYIDQRLYQRIKVLTN